MEDNTKDQQRITMLERNYAVLEERIKNISDVVYQIRDNHLVHVALDIKELNKVIEDKFGYVDQKLQSLLVSAAKQEPGSKMVYKVIEYLVIGIIGAGLALLFKEKIG